MIDFGTDISSDWTFVNGDLKLVSNEDNLIQTIINRLLTSLGSLDLFYNGYGSVLHDYMGEKLDDDTLEFIRIEIENRLVQDVRLSDIEIEVMNDNGKVRINIRVIADENDEEVELNLLLNENGELITDGSE